MSDLIKEIQDAAWDTGFDAGWDEGMVYGEVKADEAFDAGFDSAIEFAEVAIYNDGWDDATESKNKEIAILEEMIKKYEEVIDVYKVREGILRDFIK